MKNNISMNNKLIELINSKSENEVLEFKEAKNNFDLDKLGKYFSALSNEANLNRKHEACYITIQNANFC